MLNDGITVTKISWLTAHIFKMEGKSLVDKRSKQSADVPIIIKQPGRIDQRTTPYVTMYGRTPDVRYLF